MALKRTLFLLLVLSWAWGVLANGRPGTTKLLVELPKGKPLETDTLDQYEVELLQEYDAVAAIRIPERALQGLQRAL